MKKRLIVTVHGIRTFGGWQERWEEIHKSKITHNEQVDFVHYKYGYFSIISFIIPLTRFLAVSLFTRFMKEHYDNHYDVVDFYGHSFGTHLIAHSLKKTSDQELNVGTLFLTGSVLRTNFPWANLQANRPSRIVNDCGNTDAVLLINQFAVLLSGMAGRIGLNGGMTKYFRNRFHNFGHSGYFQNKDGDDDEWMNRFWVPLAHDDEKYIEPYDHRPELNWIRGLFLALVDSLEPVKFVIYSIPVALLAMTYYGLYENAVIAQTAAESNLQRSLVGQSNQLRSQALHQDAAKVTAEIHRGSLQELKSPSTITPDASQAIYQALHNPIEINFTPLSDLVKLDENEPFFSGPLYKSYGDKPGQFLGVNEKWTIEKPKNNLKGQPSLIGFPKVVQNIANGEDGCGDSPNLSNASDIEFGALSFAEQRHHFSSVHKLDDRLFLTAQVRDNVEVSSYGPTSRDDCGFQRLFELDRIINLSQNDVVDLGFAEYHQSKPWILRRSWRGVHTYSLSYAPPAFLKSHKFTLDKGSETQKLETWKSSSLKSKHGYSVLYNSKNLTLTVGGEGAEFTISLAEYPSPLNKKFSPYEQQELSVVMASDMLAVFGSGVGVVLDMKTGIARSIFELLEKPFAALRNAREPIPTGFSLSPNGEKLAISAIADASGQRYLFVLDRQNMILVTGNLMDSFSGRMLPEETSGQEVAKFRFVFSKDGNWLIAVDRENEFQLAAWRIFPDARQAMSALINQIQKCLSADIRIEFGLPSQAPEWCDEIGNSPPI